MRKDEMLDQIGKMLSEMYPSIVEADAKRITLKKGPKYDEVEKGYRWITRIYEGEYKKVKEIRNLLPQHLWDRYNSWGDFDDLQECVLLRQNLQQLKKAISHERPKLFVSKRKTTKEQNDSSGESEQQAEGGDANTGESG